MHVYWLDLGLFETLHCYVPGKVKKNTKILTCSFVGQLWFKPVTSKVWDRHVTFVWNLSLRSENLLIFEKLFWTIIRIFCKKKTIQWFIKLNSFPFKLKLQYRTPVSISSVLLPLLWSPYTWHKGAREILHHFYCNFQQI